MFGFGEVMHRANPQAWKKLRDNWDQTFVNPPVNINMDCKFAC
ncbi:Ger(x)C family spore germination C-terminal domain-containing protein [Paenibacillus nitricinens]